MSRNGTDDPMSDAKAEAEDRLMDKERFPTMPKRVDKQLVLHSLLHSFVEGSGFKEQDFLLAIHDFIPGETDPDQTPEQKNARSYIRSAIHQLNTDDSNGGKQ